MYTRTFLPAGNTLTAGVKPVAPNCSILGMLNEDNFQDRLTTSVKLWRQGTGIGFNLSGMRHPVEALRKLSSVNSSIDLIHRPKRGNMAVLSAKHPDILDFIKCKTVDGEIYNFNISVVDSEKASEEVMSAIITQAHATGDPGLIFLDRGSKYGPIDASPQLGPISTCVPCGEQFMHDYETCNLGSINLNSDILMSDNRIDFEKLRETVFTAVDILDTVVDLLVFPDEKLRTVSLKARRIGLGVTGWADYLEKIGIKYNTSEACRMAEILSKEISSFSMERSRYRALKLGPCAYGNGEYRNVSVTCIAPTGGITGLMGLKGYGIEPYFNESTSFDYKAHINMQAAWQKHIQNAISKTINLPLEATVEDVRNIYKYAQEKGCKGITIYRDQSKFNQPRSLEKCDTCSI